MDNIKTLKARLLFSLARKRKWGESHTAYENMFKSLKSEAFGKDALKMVKKLADELVRDGLIIKKPTHYGLQVSLNPAFAYEIKKMIKDCLGFEL